MTMSMIVLCDWGQWGTPRWWGGSPRGDNMRNGVLSIKGLVGTKVYGTLRRGVII